MARATTQTLSPAEVTRFLDAARETDYFVYFATLLHTALRRRELPALRWRNLDLENATVTVVETAYNPGNGKYVIREPKTPQSRRTVMLPNSLVELPEVYRADWELPRIQLAVSLKADDFVLIRSDGSLINPSVLTLAFRRIAGKAGLRDIRMHDSRDAHATLMLKGWCPSKGCL